jgi:pimeloyl-ACP methyl ester carboxylesterase
MAARAPSDDLLADMRLPVLVAVCADDRVVPPAEQQKLAAAIPGARSVTLTSGHIAPLDAPDALAAALAALVREAKAAV